MNNLLLVIAHPDDELWCSGLLAHIVSRDVDVRIVCMTRGEGGKRGHPEIATRETIGAVREEEMNNAARELGVTSIDFLDYIDPEMDERQLRPPRHDPDQFADQITSLIIRYRSRVVLTHGSSGEYCHPAHVAVYQACRKAVEKTAGRTLLYTFNAFYPGSGRMGILNRNDWATFLFDSTTFASQRFNSFWQHRTQWPLFVGMRNSDEEYRSGLREYVNHTTKESYCRHLPKMLNPEDDIFLQWSGAQPVSFTGVKGLTVRTVYKGLWALRDIAWAAKRLIIRVIR